MRTKDRLFLILIGACLAILLAPGLLHPSRMLANFGDIYAFHYPFRHLIVSRLQAGQMPFWNPYIFSGLPLLADSQTALFYPPSLLFYIFPVGYAFTWHAFFHLLLAAFGMQLLLRRGGLDSAMASALAIAFCLSPFLVYRIPQGIPTQLASLGYVPWCWLALHSGRFGLLGGIWSLQFLSGHPEFMVINALGMAVYACSEPRFLKIYLREGAMAAVLCAIQGVLTAQFLAQSNRVGWSSNFATAYSMPWDGWRTLLWPNIAGNPLDHSFAAFPSVFFEAYGSYIGLIPCALALFALANVFLKKGSPLLAGEHKKDILLCWLLAGLGVFFALGSNNPFHFWMPKLPIPSLSRVPARFGLLVVWGLLGAAAGGVLAFRRIYHPKPWVKAALFLLILLDLGQWSAKFVSAENPEPYLAAHAMMAHFLGGRPIRFASDPDLANPNKAMLYRAMNVNGYAAYFLKRYTYYVYRAEKNPAADPSRTYLARIQEPEMKRLGVGYYLTSRQMTDPLVSENKGARLYGNPGAFPLAYLSSSLGNPLTWEMISAEKWSIQGKALQGGDLPRVILAVPSYPGWKAWVLGRPAKIILEDGLIQAVSLAGIPQGEDFQVTFRFQPSCWTFLCWAAVASWLCWLFFIGMPMLRFG